MVEITDSLACLFTGAVEEHDGEHVVTVPASEIEHGAVTPGETYRVALIRQVPSDDSAEQRTDRRAETASRSPVRPDTSSVASRDTAANGDTPPEPPVSEGDVRDVTIETLGDKGDGIAKIERGYVVIVPDAKPGEKPTVEITSVRENVSFASVIEE